jgi:hypothetical protein
VALAALLVCSLSGAETLASLLWSNHAYAAGGNGKGAGNGGGGGGAGGNGNAGGGNGSAGGGNSNAGGSGNGNAGGGNSNAGGGNSNAGGNGNGNASGGNSNAGGNGNGNAGGGNSNAGGGNSNAGGNGNPGGNGNGTPGGAGDRSGGRPVASYASGAPETEISDPNSVMGLREAGEIRPLGDVYTVAEQQLGGEVIDAKLVGTARRGWSYDLRVVTEDGRVRNARYNAATLSLQSLDGKPVE